MLALVKRSLPWSSLPLSILHSLPRRLTVYLPNVRKNMDYVSLFVEFISFDTTSFGSAHLAVNDRVPYSSWLNKILSIYHMSITYERMFALSFIYGGYLCYFLVLATVNKSSILQSSMVLPLVQWWGRTSLQGEHLVLKLPTSQQSGSRNMEEEAEGP